MFTSLGILLSSLLQENTDVAQGHFHISGSSAIGQHQRIGKELAGQVNDTVLTGSGRVWLQTMPISNVAGAIRPYIPTSSN